MYYLVTAINTTYLSVSSYWVQADVRSQAEARFTHVMVDAGPASVHPYGVQYLPLDAKPVAPGVWSA